MSLAALAIDERTQRRHRAVASPGHPRLRDRMLATIEARLGDPALRTATIAAAFGVSTRTVQHVFAAMGATPVGYIAEQRLRRAADLLATDPAITITDIAFSLGFNDSGYFTRCFRQRFGIAPTAYRLRARPGRLRASARRGAACAPS